MEPSREPAGGLFSPWPRWCPWLLLLLGALLAQWIGDFPLLFVGVGILCLLSGLVAAP